MQSHDRQQQRHGSGFVLDQEQAPGISLIRPRLSPQSKARLVVWLCMIRSRIRRLGELIMRDRARSGSSGYTIRRPHSPIDRVLRVWMESVVAAEVGASGDEHAQLLLRGLIELLLHEAHTQTDYRRLFPFIIQRINAHVQRLLQDANPLLVGDVVFATQPAAHPPLPAPPRPAGRTGPAD